MPKKTKVAAIQLTSSKNLTENLEKITFWLEKAATSGAKLFVLPENAVLMAESPEDKLKIAEPYGKGPIQDLFSRISKKYKIWLLAGTIPLKTVNILNKVTASSLLYNPDGECIARYDKIHLFDVIVSPCNEIHQESKTICPGDKISIIQTPFAKLGLAICYDIRFPELFRKLFNSGVETFLVPAAFTKITGQAHFEILLRARAIENFCYVIAAAQTGKHDNGRETYGHSMIIDPWGKILNVLTEGEGFITAEIELNVLKDIRQRFPVLEHQRLH